MGLLGPRFSGHSLGEAASHVIAQSLEAFNTLGCPQPLKADDGPAYTRAAFQTFCKTFHISLTMGTPYNPQSQGTVEYVHHMHKIQI